LSIDLVARLSRCAVQTVRIRTFCIGIASIVSSDSHRYLSEHPCNSTLLDLPLTLAGKRDLGKIEFLLQQHNHLMDALIGIYKGGETNFIYPVAAGKLEAPERQDSIAPALVHLPADTVHSVANTGSARSGALHVYLGDLTRTRRHLWSLRSHQAEPFDNDRYLAGARPIG